MSVEVYTLGCRLNKAESQSIKNISAELNMRESVIVNSCAVTREAIRQSRQTIRKAKRQHQNAEIIVTGCASDIHPNMFRDMPEVNRVIPNQQKLNPNAIAGGKIAPQARETPTPAPAPVRALLRIQTGCDHHCTFCVIPKGRGASESLAPERLIKEARTLIHKGAKEIILTGVDLTSYHYQGARLGDLARQLLNRIPNLPRLRLSSLDPAAIDPALFHLIGDEARLMPHIHLSIQAGDDIILKRMRRRHLRADLLALCHRLRRLRADIAISADIIAGFPTETEPMFEATRALIRECGLASAHIFPFSPHPDTPAAKMPQLPPSLIQARARLLREEAERARASRLRELHGRTLPCLIESPRKGRAPCHALAHLREEAEIGEILPLRLTERNGHLEGRVMAR